MNIKQELKERFLNADTFIIGPYLVCLGLVGLYSINYFVTGLCLGLIACGVDYILRNRIARLRKDKEDVG
jgi:hypothetical protein